MKFLLVCFLVAGAVTAEDVLDISDRVDEFFEFANNMLTPIFDLGEFVADIGGYNASQGYLIGHNTIQRTGNCTMTSKKDFSEVTIDVHYGLGFAVLAFGKVETEGQSPFTVILRIKDNSIHASFTRFNSTETGCKVIINVLEYESLTDVQLSSSSPDLDGQDVSDFFSTQVLPAVNSQLTEFKPMFEDSLTRYVCGHPEEPFLLHNAQYLTQFLRMPLFN